MEDTERESDAAAVSLVITQRRRQLLHPNGWGICHLFIQKEKTKSDNIRRSCCLYWVHSEPRIQEKWTPRLPDQQSFWLLLRRKDLNRADPWRLTQQSVDYIFLYLLYIIQMFPKQIILPIKQGRTDQPDERRKVKLVQWEHLGE